MSGPLGPAHDQIDALGPRESDQLGAGIAAHPHERHLALADATSQSLDAGVARRHYQVLAQRALHDLPGQRVSRPPEPTSNTR